MAIGFNRSEHGKAAGMRTTLLVCLAATVAMIQVNLLLPMEDRPPGSFVMNDLMRLPLGILTGVGFIGGGAILRRENIAVAVTTAATLWLVTVIGLCMGAGQLGLGSAATLLRLCALWILQPWEERLPREQDARLALQPSPAVVPDHREIRDELAAGGLEILAARVRIENGTCRELVYEVRRRPRRFPNDMPDVIKAFAVRPVVARRNGIFCAEAKRERRWSDTPVRQSSSPHHSPSAASDARRVARLTT
jgi:putative Mg2+ transporter-C (MgtC) family protein